MRAADAREVGKWLGAAVKVITRAAELVVRVAGTVDPEDPTSEDMRNASQLRAACLRLADESQLINTRLGQIEEAEKEDDERIDELETQLEDANRVIARLEADVERLWTAVRDLAENPHAAVVRLPARPSSAEPLERG